MAQPFNLFGTPMTGMNPNASAQGAFGSTMTGLGGATQSGRSWLDPTRMAEREARLRDRMLRQQAAGGGTSGRASAAQPAPQSPLPEGIFQKSPTTGREVTLVLPTATSDYDRSALRRYGRERLEKLGARFDTSVGVYDPRTGLSQTLTPQQAMQRGLLGAAQRALLEGLNRGRTFSRTNPFV